MTRLSAMADILNELLVLHAASRVSPVLPLALFLLLALLVPLPVLSILFAIHILPSIRQVAELVLQNASLQRGLEASKITLDAAITEGSDCGRVADAKDPLAAGDHSGQSPASGPADDSESERVRALEARLDFLRDSCRIMVAQKSDLLAQRDDLLSRKDGLLAQQNVDLATLKAQLAATHQMKNDLLAEKDASCRLILAQKNEEVATIKAELGDAQQNVASIIIERDGAYSRADAIADALEKTRADYEDQVMDLLIRATDAERDSAALHAVVQQHKTEIGDILLKNDNLSVELSKVRELYNSDLERFRTQENNYSRTISEQREELAMLRGRLASATRPRTTPASPRSPRYSLQSILSRRSSESEHESDSSFDSDKPSPPRWRRISIRLPRKATKP